MGHCFGHIHDYWCFGQPTILCSFMYFLCSKAPLRVSTRKDENKKIKIFTFENTQAVTAYSLRKIYNEFVYDENDFVPIGEPEYKIRDICLNLNKFLELKKINGLLGKNLS